MLTTFNPKKIQMNFDFIMKRIDDEPLSKSLPMVLRLSQSIDASDLEKWIRLELNGYFNTNPALTEEVIVPEYRTVAGHHSDDYGRPLVIKDRDFGIREHDKNKVWCC